MKLRNYIRKIILWFSVPRFARRAKWDKTGACPADIAYELQQKAFAELLAAISKRNWVAQNMAVAKLVHETPWQWKARKVEGGGDFDTPFLLRDAAISYVTRQGSHSLVYVDDENRHIFYK
jgi:hypothetical protein